MDKKEAMEHWKSLEPNQNPLEHMQVIPYKSGGSKYGTCGIRVDGSPEFIDAVLSNLKPLLDGEGDETRLELARREVTPTEVKGQVKGYANRVREAEVCYIRLHERGHEAKRMNKGIRMMQQAAKDNRRIV